ncbi:MAG TPA: hypothetical protein VHV08_14525 [Pirellulales bacterium]|jgi:hypothetical protein|nr:hypothetical protein [Pirellulales bacterium]
MSTWWIGAALATFSVVFVAFLLWRPVRTRLRKHELLRARRDFHRHREHLEAKFVRLAAQSGKPRGLDWIRCDFDDDVIYARHRRSGEISAFVAVTIGFEAVDGGGMEEVEAVSNLRAATAVFHVEHGNWATEGRALFNLNPSEAIAYYQDNLELVGQEVAHPN